MRPLPFLIFLLLTVGCCSCVQQSEWKMEDLSGFYTNKRDQRSLKDRLFLKRERGWNYDCTEYCNLFLRSDSTYHDLAEGCYNFDVPDVWGRWSISHDSVILTPCGELELIRDHWRYGEFPYLFLDTLREPAVKVLKIISDSDLELVSHDLAGEGNILHKE
jgi:hypothetical protein